MILGELSAHRKLVINGVLGSCGRIVGNWEVGFWVARNPPRFHTHVYRMANRKRKVRLRDFTLVDRSTWEAGLLCSGMPGQMLDQAEQVKEIPFAEVHRTRRPSSSAQFCTMTIGKSSLFSTMRNRRPSGATSSR